MRILVLGVAACAAVQRADPPDVPDTAAAVVAPDGDPAAPATAARDVAEPDPTVGVRLGPVVRCEDPGARERLGPLEPPRASDPWAALPQERDPGGLFVGSGVSVADLDGDGGMDVLAARRDGVYLLGAHGRRLRLPDSARATAAIPGDADGDGDLDLAVVRYGEPFRLFRQDEGSVWVDATAEAGLVTPADLRAAVASWADADGDGDLDLFVGAHGGLAGSRGEPSPGSRLFEARGDGTFEDRSDALPESVRAAHAFAAGWHDLDRDGARDLYVVSDFGEHWPSRLLWGGDGLHLQADDGAAGLDLVIHGMGLGVGDLDGDADLDVVVPGWGGTR